MSYIGLTGAGGPYASAATFSVSPASMRERVR
jgi:hypothetical protein